MKIFRIILILFLLAFCFTFCGKSGDEKNALPDKSDIVSRAEMVLILEDVYLAEGAINNKVLKSDFPNYFADRYYNYILKKHNVTAKKFMDSYVFYSADAEGMVKILELVISDLSQKQGLLQGSTNSPAEKIK